MASLMQIAKEQAENLRAGTDWVIVWKTGRSWHAEAVSLNQTTRTWGSMEDKKRASAILELDPGAVVINGSDCYCPGEKSFMQELAEIIRENYEFCAHSLRRILQILTVPEPATAEPDRETVVEQKETAWETKHAKETVNAQKSDKERATTGLDEEKIIERINAMPIEELMEIVKKSFEDSHIPYTIEEGGKILFPGIFTDKSRSPPDEE